MKPATNTGDADEGPASGVVEVYRGPMVDLGHL